MTDTKKEAFNIEYTAMRGSDLRVIGKNGRNLGKSEIIQENTEMVNVSKWKRGNRAFK